MHSFILVVHIILAVLMIGLILVQHGKGADAGASGGGAATVFGASGSANFLTRLTAILTALFFVTSLTLAVFAKKQSSEAYGLKTVQTSTQPATAPISNSGESSPTAPKTGE